MPTIVLETQINAPAEVCFDLMRDERIQSQTPPAIFGEFGIGQKVTFKNKNLGMEQLLTVKVVELDRPRLFVDKMIEGRLKTFKHIHEFTEHKGITLIRDTLIWESPFGILGRLVDTVLLESHLRNLVGTRNAKLKSIAESV